MTNQMGDTPKLFRGNTGVNQRECKASGGSRGFSMSGLHSRL